MTQFNIDIFVLAVGFLGGIASGLFNIGGGIVVVPLLLLHGVSAQVAISSSTNQNICSSFVSLIKRLDRFSVKNIIIANILTIAGIITSYLSLLAVYRLEGHFGKHPIEVTVKGFYVVLLVCIGLSVLYDSITNKNKSDDTLSSKPKAEIIKVVLIGCLTGVLSALLGVGGGFVVVPFCMYVLRYDIKDVFCINSYQIFVISIFTTIMNCIIDHKPNIAIVIILTIGASLGARIGVWLSTKINLRMFKLFFSLLIISGALIVLRSLLVMTMSAQ